MTNEKYSGAGAAAVVNAGPIDTEGRQVTDEQIVAALSRQKIALRVRALSTAQAIAWWIVLTPDQREDCIKQAIDMMEDKAS